MREKFEKKIARVLRTNIRRGKRGEKNAAKKPRFSSVSESYFRRDKDI